MHRRFWIGLIGLFLFLFSAWRIGAAQQGLQVLHVPSSIPPMTFILPDDEAPDNRPLVLIAHGFAGSSRVMHGFALTLAHAGYVTALWDFDGHGANPRPLTTSQDASALAADVEAVLAEAQRRGLGDAGRVAILGHSMGSGVALRYGLDHPETSATIAVSPVGVSVTPELPRNLLLMAGSLEPAFLRNARARLAEAGGEGGYPAQGTARKLVVIPGVEHISILFNTFAHSNAREWLDTTFGGQPAAKDYIDRRVAWFGLGIVGAILATLCWVPQSTVPSSLSLSLVRRLVSLVIGSLGATLLLWLVTLLDLDLTRSFGMSVGGYLLLWFGVAGLIAWLILQTRLDLASLRHAWPGLLIFAALWVGVGLLGDSVWLPWLLIPRRLAYWPLAVLLLLPWFLAVGQMHTGNGRSKPWWDHLTWWAFHSLAVTGSLLMALRLGQGLYFLLLILPLFPVVFALHSAATGRQRNPWAFAFSAAMFVGWLVMAVFPLS